MKTFLRILCFTYFCFGSFAQSKAQTCPTGFTTASLNWDYLDYFSYTGFYTSANGYLASNALSRTQHFAFGTQRITLVHDFADNNSLGENGLHTGHANSYGAGDDLQFRGNGNISMTFEQAVANARFSIYDLDNNQSVEITANNGVLPVIVNMSAVAGSSISILGSGTTVAVATAPSTRIASTSTNGTVNIDVSGPLTSISIRIFNTGSGCSSGCNPTGPEDGSFWISDISACSQGTFPTGYFAESRPFTGQPGYVLHSFDKSVYALDPATGRTKLVFTDATGLGNINSMAYDPYAKVLYYVYSLTTDKNSTKLMKYDFNTEQIIEVLSDITSIGIPVVNANGVESGAAAFYNGALYLGVETSNKARTSEREAVIWRIDFNSSNAPYRASQVFAVQIDGSGLLLHDWADFVISNGVLYNFDAGENDDAGITSSNRNQSDIYHLRLQTGEVTNQYSKPGALAPVWYPGQPSVDWNGNILQIFASGAAPTTSQGMPYSLPYVAPYNGNGTIGTKRTITSTPAYTPAVPSLGDAAEAFRPRADFGDAPASYDPDPSAPALHERDFNLRLGNTLSTEWNKVSTTNNDVDDDGFAFVPILNQGGGVYQIDVMVFNNTGANATVGAWIDFNGNGTFETGEGVIRSVATNASTQSVSLYWTGINSTLPNNSNTYLRIRLTSASNGMTAANPTGFFANGEVEDWYVLVNTSVLDVQISDVTAKKLGETKVRLNWKANNETEGITYELQKSNTGSNWQTFKIIQSTGTVSDKIYEVLDNSPYKPSTYYRLKYKQHSNIKYSSVQQVNFIETDFISLYPNPSLGELTVHVNADRNEMIKINLVDLHGKIVKTKSVELKKGNNTIPFSLHHHPVGVYAIQVQTNNKIYSQKLIHKKQ